MKRLVLALALSLAIVGVYAQEHLSFKGIPIEGSMTSFCKKLQEKGFTKVGSENNTMMFTGDFTGKQAYVGVASTADGKNVYSVIVLFDSSHEWNDLVATYSYYKILYTQKYREPYECIEKNNSRVDSNTALMLELAEGKVTWESVWVAPGGTIILSINNQMNAVMEGYVGIAYIDAHNNETKMQSDLEDI
ncbi:MAG: hypothetical protein NC043_05005 [Muribaculaceae bacterium]|nr:hypothetical protein [Muribaculaceae bacterium]